MSNVAAGRSSREYWALRARSSPDFTLLTPSQRFRSSVQPYRELMSIKVGKPDLIHWSIEKCDEPKDWRARPQDAASSLKLKS